MLQVLPVPHDVLEFYRHLRRRRGHPPAGLVVLAWPAICSAAVSAVGLRRGGLRRTILISKICFFFIFKYYFIPSGPASGIQRRCLASTLRISATGVARAARYFRVSQASPASLGIPSSVARVLALPAICSAAVSAVGLRRACLRRTIFIEINKLILNIISYRLELLAVYSAVGWRVC